MKVKVFLQNEIPADLSSQGVVFIRRRFSCEWSVLRHDVDEQIIIHRRNVVLFDGNKIVGWLGVEDDGEIDNGCIEKGYTGKGLLAGLIRQALGRFDQLFYGWVPLDNLVSAMACYKATSGRLQVIDEITYKTYQEKRIWLTKLLFYSGSALSRYSYVTKLNKIGREIPNHERNNRFTEIRLC